MQQKVELSKQFQVSSKDASGASGTSTELYDYDDGLLATGGPIMIAAIAVALGIAATTFLASGEALFAVIISGFYTVMFFGIPAVMSRIRYGHDTRWQRAHRRVDQVSILTGIMGRREAVLQMVMVPIGVAFAFAAFSTIWVLARPW